MSSDKKKLRNYWPFGIAIFLIGFVLVKVIVIITSTVQTRDLVTDDYYEKGLQHQQQIERAAHANELSSPVSVRFDRATNRLLMAFPKEIEPDEVVGRIILYRPSFAKMDRHFEIKLDSTGHQALDASSLPKGMWRAKVNWDVDKTGYYSESVVIIER